MEHESPFQATDDPITNQERRALQRRAMAGRDPTEEEQARLDADMPRLEENGARLGQVGLELTGIPSIERGAGNVQRGWDEGDAIRGVGGVLQAAVGALPALGATRAGARAIAPLFSSVLRAAATSGVAAAPIGYADEAAARDKNVAEAVRNDPTVKGIKSERDALQKELDAINLKHAKSGPITHQTAVGNRVKRLETLDRNVGEAEEAARQGYIDNAPFRERYPGAAPAIMAGGLGVAAGVPAAKEFIKGHGDRVWRGPAIKEASDATAAAFKGRDPVAAAQAQDVLRRKISTWDASHGAVAQAGTTAGNAAKGALLGAEASALPEQIDHVSFEPGHPTRDAADKAFKDPNYYVGRIAPAALGATAAITGQTLGAMTKSKSPHIEDARSLADRGGRGTPVERLKEAVGLSDRSAGALDRARMRLKDQSKSRTSSTEQAPGGGSPTSDAPKRSRTALQSPQHGSGSPPGSSADSPLQTVQSPDRPLSAPVAGGKENYSDAHGAVSKRTFETSFDAMAHHYQQANPEQRKQILAEVSKMTGQPLQELRQAFASRGLGQPSDRSLREKANGTLKAIEALAAQRHNPFATALRSQIFGNAKQLVVPLTAGAAAASPFARSTETDDPAIHVHPQSGRTMRRDPETGRLLPGYVED